LLSSFARQIEKRLRSTALLCGSNSSIKYRVMRSTGLRIRREGAICFMHISVPFFIQMRDVIARMSSTRGVKRERRRARLRGARFALALVAVAVAAGIAANAAWALIIVDYYGQPGSAWIIQPATTEDDDGYSWTHTSEVEALQGQFSNDTCFGCRVRGFLLEPDGSSRCDWTDWGYVSCHLAPPGEPGHLAYTKAYCRNPHATSSRWFHCWKFRQ
jgi:hypothetical protein